MLLTGGGFGLGFSLVQFGPYGNPLLFITPTAGASASSTITEDQEITEDGWGVDSITVSAEIIAQLTTDQQTFFTGAEWSTYAEFYAAVSVESWFNAGNIMGTEGKGVAIYDPGESDTDLLHYATWWPVTLNLGTQTLDEMTQAEIDALTQAEIDAMTQY